MKFWVNSVFFSILLALSPALAAQTDSLRAAVPKPLRPVTSAYTIEAGSAHLCDTYLTPLRYKGVHLGFSYERLQAMRFNPEKWIMQLDLSLGLDKTDNPARNATMWNLELRARWGMMARFTTPLRGLRLAAGGSTGIEGGALYLDRNGNNPVSAKAAWTVNLTGMALYNMRLGRLPVTLRYQATLPCAGIFFSPDYGELYYEIYLGDTSGLAHGAWWGNRFVLDNLLTADLRLGATSLRLGYSGRIMSSKVNHIVTRRFTHAFTIGIAGEWLSLSPRRGVAPEARIISAYY